MHANQDGSGQPGNPRETDGATPVRVALYKNAALGEVHSSSGYFACGTVSPEMNAMKTCTEDGLSVMQNGICASTRSIVTRSRL